MDEDYFSMCFYFGCLVFDKFSLLMKPQLSAREFLNMKWADSCMKNERMADSASEVKRYDGV